jgi:hypothetical protein
MFLLKVCQQNSSLVKLHKNNMQFNKDLCTVSTALVTNIIMVAFSTKVNIVYMVAIVTYIAMVSNITNDFVATLVTNIP